MPDLEAAVVPTRRTRAAMDGWRAPQHRAGLTLVMSAAMSGAIGLVFWVLAARLFDPATLGVGSAVLSAVTLLASASHLNLGNAMLRFVPVADRRGAVVAGCFAAGAGCGAVVGLGFGIGANIWAPDLVAEFGHAVLITLSVVSVPIWTVFVLQEAALTAVKRTGVVLVANVAIAVLKVGLLAVGAWLGLTGAIPIGTIVATLIVVLAITGWLGRTLRRQASPVVQPVQTVTARDFVGFVGVDYAGNMCWQAVILGLPLAVVALAGPEAAAGYGVAWLITSALYVVANCMGMAMVAQVAGRDSVAVERARRGMERLTMILVLPGAVVAAVASHVILRMFGSRYAETGAVMLALLVLSAIPNVVTNAALWEARVRRHRAMQFGLPATLSAAVAVATLVLAPAVGVVGAGWAWLSAQSLAAAVILLHRRRARRISPSSVG
jgi:O-antigen/teichoic acid export membrane protein